MTTFKLVDKTNKIFETGFVSFYKIDLSTSSVADKILDSFLIPSNYPIVDESSLGRPFNLTELNSSDFKKYTRNELTHFLKNFADPKGWTNKDEITKEVNYIETNFCDINTDDFYLLSPSFFDIEDPRNEITGHVYVYYYIIVAMTPDNKMTVCNMCMD